MSEECIFCQITKGERKAEVVYQDDRVTAFHDANPVAPLHVLIVPKEHIPTLNDISEDDGTLAHMGMVAVKIATMFGVQDSGYRFFINVNKGGGQVIYHLHAHVISKVYKRADS